MEEITIRPYRKGDEFSINEAFNNIFNLKRSIDEWYWKFNPDEKLSLIMVAVDDKDKVLAHYSAVSVLMQIDGSLVQCAQSVDTYSLNNPKLYRNRVFIKTYKKYCEEYGGLGKIPYFYGCIGPRPLLLGTKFMKYTDPVAITYMQSGKTNFINRLYGMILGRFVWNRYYSQPNNLDLDAVDDLWKRSSRRYPVCTVRDGSYILNRYVKNPVNKYVCIPSWRNGTMHGLAVLSYTNRNLQWVDLVWDGIYPDTLATLKKYAMYLTFATGSRKLEMWLSNDNEAKTVLINNGMKTSKNPYDLYLSSRSFDEHLDAYDITNRLYFTMGDSDMF